MLSCLQSGCALLLHNSMAGVAFKCQDLLESDLSDVGVLMLTEQCWDQELVAKVGECCAAIARLWKVSIL